MARGISRIRQKSDAEWSAGPQVLFATKLVNPDNSFHLKFTAPTQTGDYPFVCTFPDLWRVMNGVINVKLAL